jgi:putative FmdB family regulatory protein
MPLYEYFCKSCGATFETLVVRTSEESKDPPCPKCGEKECIKLPSVFSGSAACPPSGGFS